VVTTNALNYYHNPVERLSSLVWPGLALGAHVRHWRLDRHRWFPALVIEINWRTVTLTRTGDDRIVVANSALAKSNLVITARGNDVAAIKIPLAFGADIPPETVRAVVFDAGRAMGASAEATVVLCRLTAISGGQLTNEVTVAVANDGADSAPRDEFLSLFW
jgi:hypothetical protein